MSWESGPPDPVEPQEEFVSVCNDCGEYSEYCECENPSGFTDQWADKCPACGRIFVKEDGWSDHDDCDGPSDNWYD